MGQALHGSATTLDPVRRAIQNSQASLRALAKRHGINPKTVAKWKKRETTADRPTGPSAPHSTVLSVTEEALARGEIFRAHSFELACAQNDVDHRLTKPRHRWTNGQAERMNRTLKDATVRRYYYDTHDQLRGHLGDFLAAYNFARRLKTLRGLTPYEYICKIWTIEPERFRLHPLHQMPGLNI
jgi:transposase InsO family protein